VINVKYTSYRDSSNRLTVAIEGAPSLAYRLVSWKLKRKFKLKKRGVLNKTFDEKFQEYEKDGVSVSIDWDIWSGFTVTALTPESESIVNEIGEYLEKKYT